MEKRQDSNKNHATCAETIMTAEMYGKLRRGTFSGF